MSAITKDSFSVTMYYMTTWHSAITWECNTNYSRKTIEDTFKEFNVSYVCHSVNDTVFTFKSRDPRIEMIAEYIHLTRKPASPAEILSMRWMDVEPPIYDIKREEFLDSLFLPTVNLLNRLGHQVYLGVDALPSDLKSFILDKDKIDVNSGRSVCPARCTTLKSGKTFIFLREEYAKCLLWHEAWHSLQFSHDLAGQYWLQGDLCPALPDSILQEGINRFFSSYSCYGINDIQKELPALAVENHPEFVMEVFESLL